MCKLAYFKYDCGCQDTVRRLVSCEDASEITGMCWNTKDAHRPARVPYACTICEARHERAQRRNGKVETEGCRR